MATATLTATRRAETGKGVARQLRAAGQIPAVIYGHNREPEALTVPTRELERLLEHIAAGSTVVELQLDGRSARTLIREIQRHPFKRQILHVDFQELVAGETVTVAVPLVLVGTPEGVRTAGGILDQTMREIELECDPSAIPNHIDVDVTGLQVGHSIHVRDLTLPAGVSVITDEELTVCVCVPPRTETEQVEAEEPASAEPELIRKPKQAEEEQG